MKKVFLRNICIKSLFPIYFKSEKLTTKTIFKKAFKNINFLKHYGLFLVKKCSHNTFFSILSIYTIKLLLI